MNQRHTVQPFEYVKLGLFFNKVSAERVKGWAAKGIWGHSPQKIWKIGSSEMPFLVFWEDNFCLRCSLNWLPFYASFYLPGFTYKYSILFYISCGFKSFLDISFSWVYSVGKIRTDVKIRIFPILIAYWSGFGIFKQNWENSTKLGWLDSLYMRAEVVSC